MRVLMLSQEGDGLGIAHGLIKEGNQVDVFIKNSAFASAGKGIVNRVKSWRPVVAKADLIIADMVGFGGLESTLRKLGKPLLGFNRLADMIELDRSKSEQMFNAAGILTPSSFEFANPEHAKEILTTWEDPGYVIKPDGNIETSKTFVVRDKDTFEWALTQYSRDQKLVVQTLIEGIEVSTEGWFNGRDWLRPFNHTFEEKRFLDDGFGTNTGCTGNVVITTEGDRIVEQTLQHLTPFLRRIGYRGPFDVNSIVTQEGVYALEPTPRFGYDAIEAVMEGLKEPLIDLLFEVASGVKTKMEITSDPMLAVRVSVAPWPHGTPEKGDADLPIIGLNESNLKHIYLTDARLDHNGKFYYTAGDGVVMKVTAIGQDVEQARRRAYRTIDRVGILDKQVRTDIGKRFVPDMRRLRDWGYV